MTGNLIVSERRRRLNAGNSNGFTLLEILVVLVILLIGILSVLRLFPAGFLTIKATSEATIAQSLAQQQLDSMKNLSSIPEEILPTLPDMNGNVNVFADMQPGDLTAFPQSQLAQYNLPSNLDTYFLSDINRFRYIKGENVRIPVPNTDAAKGYGSVYMLQFGPVYNQFGSDANGFKDSIQVRGAPLNRLEQSSYTGGGPTGPINTPPTLSGPGDYAIDYANKRIAFYPRQYNAADAVHSRTFTVQYAYYDLSVNPPKVITVLTGTIVVPDDNSGNPEADALWQDFPSLPSNSVLKPESETVSRKFRLVSNIAVTSPGAQPITNFWTNDPYEYAWVSDNIKVGTDSTIGNVGVLVFNPRGHDYSEQTPNGIRPLTARVDYATLDNHIIRDDRTVPPQGLYEVKLSLPFILTNGDILNDQSSYNGIVHQTTPAGNSPSVIPTPDVVICNVNTGDQIADLTNGNITKFPDANGKPVFAFSAKTGTITLDPDYVAQKGLQSASLRIFYRAQGDWGMQVQKANAHYTREYNAASVTNENYFILGTAANPAPSPKQMYFRLCEAGKTVVLGEVYIQKASVTGTPTVRLTNESYRISDNPTQFVNIGGITFTRLDLADQHPEATAEGWQFTETPTNQPVSSVQGASIKSRVIWRTGSRWHKVENDSLLFQTP